jgi:protein transport protein SEC61 subunit gamma and related proteins
LPSVVTKERKIAIRPCAGNQQEGEKMTAEGKAQGIQDSLESKVGNLGKGKYGRILKMARTPTREEYKKSCYIAAIGIILLGAVGFAIMWLMIYLPDYF